jgi:hypothetical protein
LEAVGFAGWSTWAELHATNLADVPEGPACYVVYRPSGAAAQFLPASPGGHFNGKDDPPVPL